MLGTFLYDISACSCLLYAIIIFSLLSTLCCPGHRPNKAIQDMLLSVLLDSRTSSNSKKSNKTEQWSLLLCSRLTSSGAWEVSEFLMRCICELLY